MAVVRFAKVVSALPGTLTPDTLYMVRVGAGFDLYASDSTGAVAHKINAPGKTAVTLTDSDGTVSIDVSAGEVFHFTAAQSVHTFEFINVPNAAHILLRLVGGEFGEPFALSAASYDNVSFSVNAQGNFPRGFAFNNDGTKIFSLNGGAVHQYSLSTAFDLSTASYDSVSFSVTPQEEDPYGVAFDSTGTKMFIIGGGSDAVHQYSLSTAFDLLTASYDSVSFSVNAQDSFPVSVTFNDDGTKMFVLGISSDSVYQYSLSTAFEPSTASYDGVSFSVNAQDNIPLSLVFNNDGTRMFVVGANTDTIYQYSLSTAFDLLTASYDSVSFSVNAQDSSPTGMAFNNDGTKMFIIGTGADSLHRYSVEGSVAPTTFNYPASVKWQGGVPPATPASSETDILEFITDDGGMNWYANLKMDNVS